MIVWDTSPIQLIICAICFWFEWTSFRNKMGAPFASKRIWNIQPVFEGGSCI
jgi:hypothetical protein